LKFRPECILHTWGGDDGAVNKTHAVGVRYAGLNPLRHQCVPEQDT